MPLALGGFLSLSYLGIPYLLTAWLILISTLFYLYWNPIFFLLLLFSITTNWLISKAIVQLRAKLTDGQLMTPIIRGVLFLGIAFNLGLIVYFKYVNFFIDIINDFGASLTNINGLILPLGISFYTFEQISYLVGVATGKGKNYSIDRFFLFVTFFPHLIAGPILSADELLPQFRSLNYRFNIRNLALGLTIFSVGLFKKTVLADTVATNATPIFTAADHGELISFLSAWQGAIAYTLQLYFDFSGYSDMAIGLAKLFNIKLPINFFSPYKAISIGEFWRRWHITLSRFLRDYLYIPLGGSRQGEVRRYFNLMITMLLGGLWHGANWTFVLWGGLHGLYLCIDHGWQRWLKLRSWQIPSNWWSQIAARSLTFLAVVVSWVLFRAETLDGVKGILNGMAGLNGIMLPENLATKLHILGHFGIKFGTVEYFGDFSSTALILSLLAGVFFLPNIYELTRYEKVALDVYRNLEKVSNSQWTWKPTTFWAIFTGILFCFGVGFCSSHSEFLYFQF